MLLDQLYQALDAREAQMITHRRYLHEHPELSYEEEKTAAYIADFYQGKDCLVETGIGGHGVKITIDSGKPGKTIAIRADMDALPIHEETGLPFASKTPGVMHACGHDAHTAYMMMLVDALIEMKSDLVGRIVVIHQVAEEVPPGGATFMIEDGVLDGVDNVFGIHVMSQYPLGHVYYHKGPTQQARAKFSITLQGTGGHGSSPHEANDAIVAASYLVAALQTVVSRRLSPFEQGVVTVGSFGGEGSFNVIKDAVTIVGDVRCMSDQAKETIEHQVRTIAAGMASAFECGLTVDYKNDYPVLINDDAMTQLVIDAVREAKEKIGLQDVLDCGPLPPSEDFAYYTRLRPSCFFYVGAAPKEGHSFPHHHPKFQVDEDAMLIAAKSMGAVVLKYMATQNN